MLEVDPVVAPMLGRWGWSVPPIVAQVGSEESTCAIATSPAKFLAAINQSKEQFQAVRDSWNTQWDFFLGANDNSSLLYPALSSVGQLVAVITLLFFMMQWAKDVNEGIFSRPLTELLWPFLVALLLVPNFGPFASTGYNNLAGITQFLRQTFQQAEEFVFQQQGVVATDSIEEIYPKANAVVNTQGVVQGFVAQCEIANPSRRVQDQPAQQTLPPECNCIAEELQRSINLIRAYYQAYDAKEVVWFQQRLAELERGRNLAQRVPNSSALKAMFAPGGALAWTRKTPGKTDSLSLLLLIQLGFRQTLEAALLFTALIGPIAVGASLLPVPAASKAVITWLTALVAVATAKFFYFGTLGVTSQVLLQMSTPPVDLTWFAIFLNTIAPVMSVGLAMGSGAALFKGMNNVVTLIRPL